MKVYTIGGYEEVGKNMTAVESNGQVVIFDMGYDMEEVVDSEEQIDELTTNETLDTGAIPEDEVLLDENVVGIVIGHGHLDHVGAIPKLAGAYDCPIYCSPYTKRIVEQMVEQDRKNIDNPVIEFDLGEKVDMTDQMSLEFIDVNHSIPHATLSAVNTPEGYVVYGNDMKIDQSPVIGKTTDVNRLEELGKEGVKLLVPGTTRVSEDGRARSEESVRVELEDVLNSCYDAGGLVVVSTFSSHIGRLNSLLEANNGRRKIAFVGRSLKEYLDAAEEVDLIDTGKADVVSYFNEVEDLMRRVNDEREQWLIVATGNQGEPGAQLDKMASGTYPFEFEEGDHLIFSSQVIPTPINKANRYALEKKLKAQGVRLYKGIHTTGHALKEDHRDFITMMDPDNIVPSHGTIHKLGDYVELAREEGYSLEEDIFIGENGRIIDIE
ncbi:MAG: MBL fold metallo-hydrolase [Candidatus Nanohaloarchaea archaeon]